MASISISVIAGLCNRCGSCQKSSTTRGVGLAVFFGAAVNEAEAGTGSCIAEALYLARKEEKDSLNSAGAAGCGCGGAGTVNGLCERRSYLVSKDAHEWATRVFQQNG